MTRVIIQSKSAANLKALIQLAVENEAKIIDFGIARTKRKLEAFEREFGMNTRKFYEDYQRGKLGDDLKMIKWAGEYETLNRLQKDHRELKEIELCS